MHKHLEHFIADRTLISVGRRSITDDDIIGFPTQISEDLIQVVEYNGQGDRTLGRDPGPAFGGALGRIKGLVVRYYPALSAHDCRLPVALPVTPPPLTSEWQPIHANRSGRSDYQQPQNIRSTRQPEF